LRYLVNIKNMKGQQMPPTIQVRVSPDDRAEILRAATSEGLSMSAYIRRCALIMARRSAPVTITRSDAVAQ
jgi:uncharacterized protein (DUF1778 family)